MYRVWPFDVLLLLRAQGSAPYHLSLAKSLEARIFWEKVSKPGKEQTENMLLDNSVDCQVLQNVKTNQAPVTTLQSLYSEIAQLNKTE